MESLLQPADLVRPQGTYEQRVLLPREIPIHAAVYAAPFIFSRDFADQVKRATPAALLEDISEIERMCGIRLGIEVTDDGIRDRNYIIPFDRIRYDADPERRLFSVELYSSNISILPTTHRFMDVDLTRTPPDHPLPPEKARDYAFASDGSALKLHLWYQHNVFDQGTGFFHFLRASAMAFNNEGLRRVGR